MKFTGLSLIGITALTFTSCLLGGNSSNTSGSISNLHETETQKIIAISSDSIQTLSITASCDPNTYLPTYDTSAQSQYFKISNGQMFIDNDTTTCSPVLKGTNSSIQGTWTASNFTTGITSNFTSCQIQDSISSFPGTSAKVTSINMTIGNVGGNLTIQTNLSNFCAADLMISQLSSEGLSGATVSKVNCNEVKVANNGSKTIDVKISYPTNDLSNMTVVYSSGSSTCTMTNNQDPSVVNASFCQNQSTFETCMTSMMADANIAKSLVNSARVLKKKI